MTDKSNETAVVVGHTPGPWDATLGASGMMAVEADDGSIVASYVADANARLIAAAPDGLEVAVATYLALLAAVDVRHRFQAELCALRDFIAKATGRGPQEVQDQYDGMVLAAIAKAVTP